MDNEKLRPQEPVKDVRFEKPTFIDPLTGLFNRYYLYEFLPQEIKKSQFSDYSLGVFIIDIDNFKGLNDKYGHLSGDEILKQFSDALKKTRRLTDMVIRYAGDEFMILLPGVDKEAGLSLGKRLLEQIAQTSFRLKDGQEIRLTISMGFSLCPADSTEVDKLIDLADKALYLSKEKGKNQISYSQEVTLESAAAQIALDFFPCPKFIDREAEMAKLKSTYSDTVLGKSLLASVLIYGETGTGKSRLASEFNGYAQNEAVVLYAKGAHKHTEDPYYLFASALDNYLSNIRPHSLQAQELISILPEEELAELTKLLPQIEGARASLGGKEGRALLFKSMLDLLIAINSKNPLVLSFDDLQWADNASIELLHYLIKYETKRKILAVVTLKGKPVFEQGEKSALAQLLEYLHNGENAIEIPLPDLAKRDTHEMIEAMFPGLKQIKELNDSIFEITKGNPAFIEEIFKSLAENKLLVYKDNGWDLTTGLEAMDIPNSLEETIKRRVKTLDKETKELIVQAAVIGEDFSVDLLKKLGENNEGYIFEVMARAKKKHLVKESEKIGKFNFINSGIQDALYNELSEEDRKNLHQKIGEMLAAEHKEDLSDVAADLSLHFGKAAGGVISEKYGHLLEEKAADLFNPAEVIDYLKEFATGAIKAGEEKDIKLELVALTRVEISRLIKLTQSAVKNFQLYPAGSSIRGNFAKDIHHSLELILQDTPRLEIIESGNSLVINGRRFSSREIQELGEGDFISLMVESNIKSLSFTRGISEEEVSVFLDNFSQPRRSAANKNIWKAIIQEKRLAHIRIDEFSYEEIAKPVSGRVGPRKKFEEAMMMEFLLGKIGHEDVDKKSFLSKVAEEPEKFAAAISKIAAASGKQDKTDEVKALTETIKKISAQIPAERLAAAEAVENLAKVIQELDWKLKTKFIRLRPQITSPNKTNITDEIINKLPAQEIISLIERSIREGSNNPLVVKDLIDKVAPSAAKKKEIMPLVEAKLTELGMDKETAGSLCGKTSWDKLAREKRLKALLDLPQEELATIDLSLVGAFMEELFYGQNTPGLKSLIQSFILKALAGDQETQKKISKIIKEFICKDAHILNRGQVFLEILKAEADPKVYSEILDIIKWLSEDFIKSLEPEELYLVTEKVSKKDYVVFISEVFSILEKRLKSKIPEELPLSNAIIAFVQSALKLGHFLEVLVAIILDHFQAEPKRIKALLEILGPASCEALLDICLNAKKIAKDSFEGYALRKRVAAVLKEIGEVALVKVKKYLSEEKNKENLLVLLELAGYLAKEDLSGAVEPFLYHEDLELRRQAVSAIGAIGTKKTDDILTNLLEIEKNKEVQLLVKKVLSKKIK